MIPRGGGDSFIEGGTHSIHRSSLSVRVSRTEYASHRVAFRGVPAGVLRTRGTSGKYLHAFSSIRSVSSSLPLRRILSRCILLISASAARAIFTIAVKARRYLFIVSYTSSGGLVLQTRIFLTRFSHAAQQFFLAYRITMIENIFPTEFLTS